MQLAEMLAFAFCGSVTCTFPFVVRTSIGSSPTAPSSIVTLPLVARASTPPPNPRAVTPPLVVFANTRPVIPSTATAPLVALARTSAQHGARARDSSPGSWRRIWRRAGQSFGFDGDPIGRDIFLDADAGQQITRGRVGRGTSNPFGSDLNGRAVHSLDFDVAVSARDLHLPLVRQRIGMGPFDPTRAPRAHRPLGRTRDWRAGSRQAAASGGGTAA